MAHTPGPWIRDGRLVYALTENTGNARSRRIMPMVNRFSASIQGGNEESAPDEEMEANALLIAAAPDLLEALKALPLEAFDKDMDAIDAAEFVDNAGDFFTAMVKARAAIAKVKGQS